MTPISQQSTATTKTSRYLTKKRPKTSQEYHCHHQTKTSRESPPYGQELAIKYITTTETSRYLTKDQDLAWLHPRTNTKTLSTIPPRPHEKKPSRHLPTTSRKTLARFAPLPIKTPRKDPPTVKQDFARIPSPSRQDLALRLSMVDNWQ